MEASSTHHGGVPADWGRSAAQNTAVNDIMNSLPPSPGDEPNVQIIEDPDTGIATIHGPLGSWAVDVQGNRRRI